MSIDSTDHTASYATLPADVTSSSGRTDIVSKAISWTVSNAATDANGFGLIRIGDQTKTNDLINDRCWYFQTTQDVNGTTSSSESITLDSVDDLIVGMVIYSGTGLSGTPTIRTVDAAAKTITLSTSQSISDGVTLTFRASCPIYILCCLKVPASIIYKIICFCLVTNSNKAKPVCICRGV